MVHAAETHEDGRRWRVLSTDPAAVGARHLVKQAPRRRLGQFQLALSPRSSAPMQVAAGVVGRDFPLDRLPDAARAALERLPAPVQPTVPVAFGAFQASPVFLAAPTLLPCPAWLSVYSLALHRLVLHMWGTDGFLPQGAEPPLLPLIAPMPPLRRDGGDAFASGRVKHAPADRQVRVVSRVHL
jgi:hypothetical protein